MQNIQYSQDLPTQETPRIQGDIIEQLPSDKTTPSQDELRIVDTLFKKQKSTIDKILTGTRDVLLIGILYIIFSLKPLDSLIYKFFPSSVNSEYILVMVKGVLFMASYFILKNLYLVKL